MNFFSVCEGYTLCENGDIWHEIISYSLNQMRRLWN